MGFECRAPYQPQAGTHALEPVAKRPTRSGVAIRQPARHPRYRPTIALGIRALYDGALDRRRRRGLFWQCRVDLRYGVTSSLSLNATVNPDFGQVEADPAQLNLTAFVDFFCEQRPFFVEGASIFQTGDYDLLYSRRIGRRPGYFPVPEDAVEEDRPEATTILGALKMTGKTEGKTLLAYCRRLPRPNMRICITTGGSIYTSVASWR